MYSISITDDDIPHEIISSGSVWKWGTQFNRNFHAEKQWWTIGFWWMEHVALKKGTGIPSAESGAYLLMSAVHTPSGVAIKFLSRKTKVFASIPDWSTLLMKNLGVTPKIAIKYR